MKKHLIAFAKKPWPGYAKTRLGNKIGFEEAAGVYARFLYHCLFELVELSGEEISIELSLASESDQTFFNLAFPEFLISFQVGVDLGQRLTHALKGAFDDGAELVVIVGTDIPDLDRRVILSAFQALNKTEVVIGPCLDGGYYLIGTRNRTANLFENIRWSENSVLLQTEQLIRTQNFSFHLLPFLSDIDTVADYHCWLDSII